MSTTTILSIASKNTRNLVLLALIICLTHKASFAQAPTFTSFSPTSGPIGTSVTITGTGFNTTAANNIVFFGATKATITAAASTSLTVTVPLGADYQCLSVTNLGVNLTAYSEKPFGVTVNGNIDFAPQNTFAAGSSPRSVAIGDIDGDGKPDLAVVNWLGGTISVYLNTSSPGVVNFASQLTFSTGGQAESITIGDIDGDGKPDLAVADNVGGGVLVFRNTSTVGNISFDSSLLFFTGAYPFSVAIGDIDGDGKPDLVVANDGSNSVSVLHNTSTVGNISFAGQLAFSTGTQPNSVSIGDIDGDGKPDLVLANWVDNTLSVLHNNYTIIGTPSFATQLIFSTGGEPNSVSIGDIDGDGKPDLVVANDDGNSVSVFHNNYTTVGTPSFATQLFFTAGTGAYSLSIGDIDGDGKPDLLVGNNGSNTVAVLHNNYSTVGTPSFATQATFVVGDNPYGVNIGDIDGDGKLDLAAANLGSNTVSVLRQEFAPQGSLTANGPFCVSGTGQLTWTATGGSGPFTIVYNDGTANRTDSNVQSGVPFNVYINPVTVNTIYTMVSIIDSGGNTVNSGFTGPTATINVNPNCCFASGIITLDTTWSCDTVKVVGSVMVNNGVTLTINPGVVVEFMGEYELLVLGRILAMGNTLDSIAFIPADTVGGWRGIRFDHTTATNDTSKISYCNLSYGKATGASPEDKGGAFYLDSFSKVIISNSFITHCTSNALGGGTIYCAYSSPIIVNNLISFNSPVDGGIVCDYNSNPMIANNVMTHNTCSGNGGCGVLCVSSSPTISGNTISNNSTTGYGAAIWCNVGNPYIIDNIITNNTTINYNGGAIYFINGGNPSIINNVIANNKTKNSGGGIYCYNTSPNLTNNTIVNNAAANGGGLYFDGNSVPPLQNNILYGNTASSSGAQVYLNAPGSNPNFYYSDVQGGSTAFGLNGIIYTGTYANNIDSTPLFVSPSAGSGTNYNGSTANWSLQSGSPCINTGDPNQTYPTTDLAGNPRVVQCHIDMGAYEYQTGTSPYVSAAISASATHVLCAGAIDTFTVTALNAGSSPSYQWKNKGVALLGQTGAIYIANGLVFGDTITCIVTSSDSCPLGNPATSNAIALALDSFTIDVSSNSPVCVNNSILFSASVHGLSSTFHYTWSGPNLFSSTVQNPSLFAAGDGGVYSVTAIDTNACSASATINIALSDTPTISLQKLTAPVCPNSPVIIDTLSTTGGGTNLSFQWQYWGGNNWLPVSNGANGASYSINGPLLTIDGIGTSGSYFYRCLDSSLTTGCVSRYCQPDTIYVSTGLALLLNGSSANPNINVCSGGDFQLRIDTSGGSPPFSFKWQLLSGGLWSNVSGTSYIGGTSPMLAVSGLPVGTYQFRCYVSPLNQGTGSCSVDSTPLAIVHVTPPLSIHNQPDTSIALCNGGQINLSVAVTGGSDLVYNWQGRIASGNWTPINVDSNTLNETLNAPGSYYYKCVITDSSGSCSAVFSDSLHVYVRAQPASTYQLRSHAICVGGADTILLDVSGGTQLNFNWQVSSDSMNSWAGITGNNNLSFIPVSPGSYYYKCILSDTSKTCDSLVIGAANVQVRPQPVESNLKATAAAVCINGEDTISIAVSGGTDLTYSWQERADTAQNWSSVSGGVSGLLPNVFTQTGTYFYRAVLSDTSRTCVIPSVDSVMVVVDGQANYTPKLTNPVSCTGGTDSFILMGQGGAGTFMYTWEYFYNGIWITDSTNLPAGAIYSNIGSPEISVSGIAIAGSYTYRCIIQPMGNGCSIQTTPSVIYSVKQTPQISIVPFGSATKCLGSADTISLVSDSASLSSYQWQVYASSWGPVVNGLPGIYNNDSAHLIIENLSLPGNYSFRYALNTGINGCGNVYSDTVKLKVLNNPLVNITAEKTQLCVGDTLTLNLTNNGAEGTTYILDSSVNNSLNWGGVSINDTFVSQIFPIAEEIIYKLVGQNICAADTSQTPAINIYNYPSPPVVLFDSSICLGSNNISFTVSNNVLTYHYEWSILPSESIIQTDSSGSQIEINFLSQGPHVLLVTSAINNINCRAVDTIPLTVVNSPAPGDLNIVLTQPGNNLLCLDDSLNYYEWGYDSKITGEVSVIQGDNSPFISLGPDFITDTITNAYWVIACNGNQCCSKEYFNQPTIFTGIKDPVGQQINIYPNPTTGMVTLNNTYIAGFKAEIWSIDGQLLRSNIELNASSSMLLNISNLSAGTYFIKVSDESGSLNVMRIITLIE